MICMDEETQKNFTIPVNVIKLWEDFLAEAKRDNGPNGAGALLLFTLVKPEVADVCKIAAYSKDIELALKTLRDNLPRDIIKILPEDAELYGPKETNLSPGKKAFRREVLKILRESGILPVKGKKTKKGRSDQSSSKAG